MASPLGVTHGLTDADWLPLRDVIGPDGEATARDRTGAYDLAGARSGSPTTVLSARPAGTCRPTRFSERMAVTGMTDQILEVAGGVDTPGETHHAAIIDRLGQQLADREFTLPPGPRLTGPHTAAPRAGPPCRAPATWPSYPPQRRSPRSGTAPRARGCLVTPSAEACRDRTRVYPTRSESSQGVPVNLHHPPGATTAASQSSTPARPVLPLPNMPTWAGRPFRLRREPT